MRTRTLLPAVAAGLLLSAAAAPTLARSAPAVAGPRAYLFADIAFGTNAEKVTELLEKRGYRFKGVDEDGDYEYMGRMMGAPTRVYAYMADKKLVRVNVLVATEDEDARETYARMRETMIAKYGQPTQSVEEYDRPYKAGDGREDEAVKKGAARIWTMWTSGKKPNLARVAIGVTEELAVRVIYDSPEWRREDQRRQAGTQADLE
jgi:hypothetical protein